MKGRTLLLGALNKNAFKKLFHVNKQSNLDYFACTTGNIFFIKLMIISKVS